MISHQFCLNFSLHFFRASVSNLLDNIKKSALIFELENRPTIVAYKDPLIAVKRYLHFAEMCLSFSILFMSAPKILHYFFPHWNHHLFVCTKQLYFICFDLWLIILRTFYFTSLFVLVFFKLYLNFLPLMTVKNYNCFFFSSKQWTRKRMLKKPLLA